MPPLARLLAPQFANLFANLFATLFAILLVPLPAAASEAPRVVASIKPVHSLVASVMQGVGEPVLLLPPGASPHTYSMRPSDAQVLRRAQLVFWVGEGLETFLVKPLTALGTDARPVALAQAPGVRLLPYRTGDDWEPHVHAEPPGTRDHDAHDDEHEGPEHAGPEHDGPDHADHDDDAHEHAGGSDMHIWLDPQNAQAMAAAIAEALAALDPQRAGIYRSNAAAVVARLAQLDARLKSETAPLADKPYVVFHDAYQYFERRYGLSPAGSITISPDRPPSARRLQAIRAKIEGGGVICVFAEPQFEPALVRTVVAGTNARIGTLDVEGGAEVPAGADAYFLIMQNLAASLKSCLLPSG